MSICGGRTPHGRDSDLNSLGNIFSPVQFRVSQPDELMLDDNFDSATFLQPQNFFLTARVDDDALSSSGARLPSPRMSHHPDAQFCNTLLSSVPY